MASKVLTFKFVKVFIETSDSECLSPNNLTLKRMGNDWPLTRKLFHPVVNMFPEDLPVEIMYDDVASFGKWCPLGTGGRGGEGRPSSLLNLSCVRLLFYTFPVSSHIMTRVTKCPKAIILHLRNIR